MGSAGGYKDACYAKYFSCHLNYMHAIMSDNAKRVFPNLELLKND